ncbi:MAG: hypothetical protein ABMA14_19800 [Hyphomonadaceae bacterium]
MTRLALLPISLVFACVLAGAYGAVHDQISYTVAPSYYHDFKFIQFAIDPTLHNRLGASIVGWNGSWWMGILIGLPIYIVGLFVRGNGEFCRAYLLSALLVVLTALMIGLAALALSFLLIDVNHLPTWMTGRSVESPLAFARAGTMHNWSYLGGFVGLIAGVILMILAARKTRRERKTT